MRNLCVIKIKEKVFKVRIYIRRSKPTRAILGLAVDVHFSCENTEHSAVINLALTSLTFDFHGYLFPFFLPTSASYEPISKV